MRIEEIRFSNLNSLVGEWAVDFTHPDYVTEGLFAITGPTGAGKSTILDAICLALYGRTPRLGTVSAADNEIMSRQTGQCSAEVTFATRHGRYRCSWHQRRARNRPDGALQPIERRFCNADTGEVLEQHAARIKKAVESATGMDFDRFTRSVMLAQGGFAAFLFSEPEQRSRILESLTGTEVYRDISCRVHMRHSEEKHKLESLKSRLQGINLLSPDDEARLQAGLEDGRRREAATRVELTGVETHLHRLRGLEQLRAEKLRLEARQAALLTRHTAFEPQRRLLRRAEKAQALRPAFTELLLADKTRHEVQQRFEQNRAAVPVQEQQVLQAEHAATRAAVAADTARKTHETSLPTLREAGKLDALLVEKDTRLQAEETALAAARKALDQLQTARTAHRQEREVVRAGLLELARQLEAHSADKALVASLAGLEERFANARRLHTQVLSGQAAAAEARKAGEREAAHLAAQLAQLTVLQTAETEARTRLETRQTAVLAALQGRELSVWREELTRLVETKNQVLAAQDVCRRREAGSVRQQALQAEIAALTTRQEIRQTLLIEQETRLKALLAENAQLEREAARFRLMAGLAGQREQLEDGQECPLCGARHHPFAAGNVPAPDTTFARLTTARQASEAARAELEKLRMEQAAEARGLQENTTRRQELAALDAELNAELVVRSATLAELTRMAGLAPSAFAEQHAVLAFAEQQAVPAFVEQQAVLAFAEQQAVLATCLAATEASLAAVTKLLAGVEVDEKALPSLRTALQAAADKVTQARLAHSACLQKRETAQQDCARLERENRELAERLQALLHNLEAEVLPYGEETVSVAGLDNLRNRLCARRERWLGLTAQDADRQRQLATLDAQLAQEDARLHSDGAQVQTRDAQVQHLAAERRAVHEQRVRCFAGDDPAREEARLVAAVDEAGTRARAAEATLAATRQTLAALQADLVRLQAELTERGTQRARLQDAFALRLRESGFADQADFTAASLEDAVVMRLAGEERALDEERIRLDAQLTQVTQQCAEQEAGPRIADTLPELEAAQQRLQTALTRVLNELGGLEQTLRADAEARTRHAAVLADVTRQQAECGRWGELNALIGSSDGKKYSKFAQGITFEIMLEHANRQLQVMKDRYLLVRDAQEPLAVNVVDSFQAGEVRPTTNLSGGESFLVSLALALGLSRMASQNVRVDSLFLDEGFGSLDEDALETALSTISSLREEGKLIGLISHVPSIKERVLTQIAVTPTSGGKSRLEGPGVSANPK